MVRPRYVPDMGDLIWLDFDPQAGREQAGHRPAIVLSPASYNERSGLAVVCPITSHVKGYPFEVLLPQGLAVTGAILSDHLKSLDWALRRAKKAGRVPLPVLREIRNKLARLLSIS